MQPQAAQPKPGSLNPPTENRDFMIKLRNETAKEHKETEDQVDLSNRGSTVEDYKSLLLQFWNFYNCLEQKLDASNILNSSDFPIQFSKRTPWLKQDLTYFGYSEQQLADAVSCTAMPDVQNLSQLIGTLYVIEGSSLGSQIIARHLKEHLNVDAETGGRFFAGNGAETGPRWRDFGSKACQLIQQGNEDEAVSAAKATFYAFKDYIKKG